MIFYVLLGEIPISGSPDILKKFQNEELLRVHPESELCRRTAAWMQNCGFTMPWELLKNTIVDIYIIIFMIVYIYTLYVINNIHILTAVVDWVSLIV